MAEETKEEAPALEPLRDIYSAVGRTAAEILPSLVGVPKDWADSAKHRKLMREGVIFVDNPAWDDAKPRWALLFTDCLLITKPDCEWTDDFELRHPEFVTATKSTGSDGSSTTTSSSKHGKRNSGMSVMKSLLKRGKKTKKTTSESTDTSSTTTTTEEDDSTTTTATDTSPFGARGKSEATMALERAKSAGIVRGIAVGSADVAVKFRLKQMFSLPSLFLNESKKFCEEKCQSKHPTFVSDRFALSGQCRVMSDITRSMSSDEKSVTLVCSAKTAAQKELWLSRIHTCIVQSINPELQTDYAWQSTRRLGTLHSAIIRKSKAQVSELIATGEATVDDCKDAGGHTVLHIACAYDFDWFIDIYGNRCDPSILDPNGDSCLTIVCKRQNSVTLQALINKCKCDWNENVPQDFDVDDYSTSDLTKAGTPLSPPASSSLAKKKKAAAASSSSSGLKSLPNERNYLHVFAQNNNSDMIDTFVSNTSINIEAFDGYGKTPLHIAAEFGSEQAVISLVQGGSPCNIKDYNLDTPLHLCDSIRCARWIAAYGGRIDVTNKNGVVSGSKWETELKACAKLWSSMQARDAVGTGVILEDSLWMEDELSQSCFLCSAKFTFFLRKHHCRFCGLLVCGPCSTQKMDGVKAASAVSSESSSSSGGEKGLRSCDKCFAKGMVKLSKRQSYELNGKKWTVMPKTFLKMAVLDVTGDAAIADAGSTEVPFTRKAGGAHASSATADPRTLRSTASHATSSHTSSQSTGMTSEVSAARSKAAANLEKTKIIADKSADVRVQSEAFADMAKKLSEKYK